MNNMNKSILKLYKDASLYKQYSEDMQRVNQQWSNLFWKTSIGQHSERQERKQEQR
jgi:hypothetical protein